MEQKQAPQAIQADTRRLISDTQLGLQRIEDRLRSIPKISEIVSIDDYNRYFNAQDNALADYVGKIVFNINSSKVYAFGYQKPSFDYGDKSKLRRKACNCAYEPLSVVVKKDMRNRALSYLYGWIKAANEWIKAGMLELNEPKPIAVKTTSVSTIKTVTTRAIASKAKTETKPTDKVTTKYIP